MHDHGQLQREFDQLIHRHRKLVDFLCHTASYGQERYYRELLQDCYIALLEGLSRRSPRPGLPGTTWVYWQCRGAITSYKRRLRKIAEVPLSDTMVDSLTATHEATDLTIDELASCLDGTERQAFRLMAQGISDEELAKALALSHRSVIQMRHNIKKKLEQYIQQ